MLLPMKSNKTLHSTTIPSIYNRIVYKDVDIGNCIDSSVDNVNTLSTSNIAIGFDCIFAEIFLVIDQFREFYDPESINVVVTNSKELALSSIYRYPFSFTVCTDDKDIDYLPNIGRTPLLMTKSALNSKNQIISIMSFDIIDDKDILYNCANIIVVYSSSLLEIVADEAMFLNILSSRSGDNRYYYAFRNCQKILTSNIVKENKDTLLFSVLSAKTLLSPECFYCSLIWNN